LRCGIGEHVSDLAVAGYRCFKAVMFLTGFIFGSIIVYLICLQEKLMPVYGNAGTVFHPHEGAKLTVSAVGQIYTGNSAGPCPQHSSRYVTARNVLDYIFNI
jgi:hypothetical protein